MNKQPEITANTRKKIIDAFWSICTAKNINNVTIREIAQKAQINRSTFYQYFSDVYELLEAAEAELIETVCTKMEKRLQGGRPKSLLEFSKNFVDVYPLFDEKVFYLLGDNGDSTFKSKLEKVIKPRLISVAGISEDLPNIDYAFSFTFSGAMGMMTHWHQKGEEVQEEELLNMMYTLVVNGISGFTGKKLFEEAL